MSGLRTPSRLEAAALPVDFRTCRSRSCATDGPPVLFVHAVHRDGFLYLEYWEYLPDSTHHQTSRLGGLPSISRPAWQRPIPPDPASAEPE